MPGAEPNQNNSSPPVSYISTITQPSSRLALLEFKFSDLIKFHLGLYGFNLPMKNGFWHFIWLPCMGSKWAGLLMKLFTRPATQCHWRQVNTHTHARTCTHKHSALLCHPGQSRGGDISPSDSSLVWVLAFSAQNIPQTDVSPSLFLSFFANTLFTWADNKLNFRSVPGIHINLYFTVTREKCKVAVRR